MARPVPTVPKAVSALIKRGSRLLLAVSGGKDSVALLHACVGLQDRLALTLEVAHVNHGLRPAAAADAHFVAELAARYGLPCHLHEAGAPSAKENVEAWGRRVRYRFFNETLDARALEWALTAHTADDAAETLLMRLLSNKELTTIERMDRKRRCLRPLLAVPRRTVEQYISVHQLPFVEDESNSDCAYLRNRVRHCLLPLLRREFDPRIEETLACRAEALAEDRRMLYALLLEGLERVSLHERFSRGWLRAARAEISEMAEPLRWRFAEQLLKPYLGYNLGRAKSRDFAELLARKRTGVELPGGISLRAHAGGLREVRE